MEDKEMIRKLQIALKRTNNYLVNSETNQRRLNINKMILDMADKHLSDISKTETSEPLPRFEAMI